MKKLFVLITLTLLFSYSCQIDRGSNGKKVKYIFLFIGDGMGIQHVNTTQVYLDSVLDNNQKLSFIDFPIQTFFTTYAANQYITCSAAAGTALSTGSKTSIGTLGLNYNHTDTLFSIAKKFKDNGFKVGILTSVSIDHATPAAFYAHQGSRGSNYDIALDLLKSGYDFYAGGGFLDPYGKKLKDSVESIYSMGQKYSFAFTKNIRAIDSLSRNFKSLVYSIPNPASESSFKLRIDQDSTDITLADVTKKAIETLDNPKGFFMMVEGGKIDWTSHSNDAASTIYEVIDFSDAVAQAVEFYNSHPDETLIIVTADHETGGFSLGNKPNKYTNHLSLLKNQKMSKDLFYELVKNKFSNSVKPSFQELLDLAEDKIGLGKKAVGLDLNDKDKQQLLEAYNTSIKLSRESIGQENYMSESKEKFSLTCFEILNRKAAIGWTSASHTGSPVPMYVIGNGKELFLGRLDNTDISKIIDKIAFK